MSTTYDERPVRVAEVTSASSPETVARYLPSNYSAFTLGDGKVVIVGHDDAGWTMDDYVLPRLASGLHVAVEVIS